ncbi:MAG: ATPase [Leptospiraceae bacterium]|nr:ATPase [Leptospiraceae bacterium]MDW8306949.1 ATPase [Leptospiraceae bacterium]
METIVANVGLALMIGLSGGGSAIGLSMGGSAVLGMVKRRPEAFGNGLVLSALPATQGLYGFVAFILYTAELRSDLSLFDASVILGAGLMVGLSCLISAIQQGHVCANGISALASGHDTFGKTMILAAFPEFYAILSLVAAILMKDLLAR